MQKTNSVQLFKVEQVDLVGSNIIEASAGTGKTYSIGILVIRLLLECKLNVQEILMVTFTKAAVAELQTRVRFFIMEAEKASLGTKIEDEKIAAIVDRAIQKSSASEVCELLRTARIFLDEVAVFTIHGFCQRTLGEFAFETGQLFAAEALSETESKEITQDAINDFWRKKVTTLEPTLLKELLKKWLNRKILEKLIDEALSGKKFEVMMPLEDSYRSNCCSSDFLHQIHQCISKQEENWQLYLDYITYHSDEIRQTFKTTPRASKSELIELLSQPEVFAISFKEKWEKKDTKYILQMDKLCGFLETYNTSIEVTDLSIHPWINQFFQLAIETILGAIETEKKQRSRISFDDMINSMYQSVSGSGAQALLDSVRKKYKAVFIDEFQDTDRWQYEIFHRIFEGRSLLFYIGDPKQSIYGWRKADIFTYFKAVAAVNSKFYMDTNFRSSETVINAQNKFFQPVANHDTFHFENDTDRIDYQEVVSPQPNTKGELFFDQKPVVPFTVFDYSNEDEVVKTVTAQVIELLTKEYSLPDKSANRRSLKPSDIGILVRSNKQGTKIKAALAKCRIPAVTIDETKLFATEEAQELLFVLEAVHEISNSNINRALLTKFTGWSIEELKRMDEQMELKKFKDYQSTWKEKGIYVMLRKFMADFKVRWVLMEKLAYNGDRILSNLLQLMELLHKIQTSKDLSAAELIHWLKKGIDGAKLEGEEFEQRVESDEEAVNIVTIHKSKGLEYNIVFIPFMSGNGGSDSIFSTYRVEADGSYHFDLTTRVDKNTSLNQQINRIAVQENRRLLYVAITRARYKCYINYKDGSDSVLSDFIPLLKGLPVQDLIAFEAVNPSIEPGFKYKSGGKDYPTVYAKAKSFKLEKLHWRKMSYTALSPEHPPQPIPVQEVQGAEYDHFIFRDLKKGAFTGNLLHYLFERIDFRNSEKWEKIVTVALKRLGNNDNPAIVKGLVEMLHHVMKVKLSDGEKEFTLSEIGSADKMTEMEFDFVVQPFDTKKIVSMSADTRFAVKPYDELEGIMNGKVDLIFKYGEKYYILDWKSNHLGYDLKSYESENLLQAMDENNYHLQYHIYTDALDRYLKLRLPAYEYGKHFGGVFYLFLRGIRKTAQSGVFFRKPDKNLIGQFPW